MEHVYEGMFIVSPVVADAAKQLEAVQRILSRAGAEVLVCKKWEERKLAYEVRKQKRGIYVLSYFKAAGGKIADIEKDVQLSEDVLRVLIIRADEVTREQMEAPTPAETGRAQEVTMGGDEGDDRPFRRRRDDSPAVEEIEQAPEQE